jgi:hypothetical protein
MHGIAVDAVTPKKQHQEEHYLSEVVKRKSHKHEKQGVRKRGKMLIVHSYSHNHMLNENADVHHEQTP